MQLKRSGLSLFEVLVAVAIFLMSLVALSQLIDVGSDLARDVQWLSRAMMLAESRLAEVTAGSIPLTAQSESPCEEDGDFNWSLEVEADSAPGLYRVNVRVTRPRSDGSTFETSLAQMVLDPTLRGSPNPPEPATSASTGGILP